MKVAAPWLKDPNGLPMERWSRIKVLLDGAMQRGVVEADDVEGYVVLSMIDNGGQFLARGYKFVTERKTGKVEIIVPPA